METYTTIGKCPICGADLKDYRRAYGCSNWKHQEDGSGDCQFTVWKDTYGKLVTIAEMEQLLKGERLGVFKFFTKDGVEFKAYLELNEETKEIQLIED